MITRAQARSILEQFAHAKVARLALSGDMGGPLVLLGVRDNPFKHIGTLKDAEDGKSAYHIAHAMHDVIDHLGADSLTVCMFAYKVIQGVKYHGFMLYHVDDEGTTHTRILDPESGHHWILDGSPYWKPFPYTFGDGPHEMPAILGRHDEVGKDATPAFDELLRP